MNPSRRVPDFPCPVCPERYMTPTLAAECGAADEAHDEDLRAGVEDPVPCGADLLAARAEGLG